MIPVDYCERVYAGVLGKMIGVYLGRPVEGWTYERIIDELGEIDYYVHDRLGRRLVVTDDDLTGTFTFLRALADHAYSPDLTPAQIGETWLNYIIEGRTILWWGGMGNSSEHTAYLRLKSGLAAPLSGSAALNGKIVSEQIGAQIFIDGWGMVSPGDPERAADLARRAASVSHDGEAVYGAQVIAALEAQSFTEKDLGRLLDVATRLIPRDSILYRLIFTLREWRETEPDWRSARQRLAEEFGYHRYPGSCHIIPNHGVILLSLLYGDDQFQKTLMIANTCGWDTDCNSGNAGCLLGIKNGLAGIAGGPDWRGPLADRLLLPTADGGEVITDAVQQAYRIINAGRSLAGEPLLQPKDGARFHFELPGSVQGFQPDRGPGLLHIDNHPGHSRSGTHSLALSFSRTEPVIPVRAGTATFISPGDFEMSSYPLLASPTLYPGQTVTAGLYAGEACIGVVRCRLYIKRYRGDDDLQIAYSSDLLLPPGIAGSITWQVEGLGAAPIAEVGLELEPSEPTAGVVYLDYLTWSGEPDLVFTRPPGDGIAWRRAWIEGVDRFVTHGPLAFRLAQNLGRGLLIQGTRDWRDYRVSAEIIPLLSKSAGIAARVQGMRRYYALLVCRGDTVRLVKFLEGEQLLGERSFPWEFGQNLRIELQVQGSRIQAWVAGQLLFDLDDQEPALTGGGVALVVEEGCLDCDRVTVRPAVQDLGGYL